MLFYRITFTLMFFYTIIVLAVYKEEHNLQYKGEIIFL